MPPLINKVVLAKNNSADTIMSQADIWNIYNFFQLCPSVVPGGDSHGTNRFPWTVEILFILQQTDQLPGENNFATLNLLQSPAYDLGNRVSEFSCWVWSALSFPVGFSSNFEKRSPSWGPRNLHKECAHSNGWSDKHAHTTQPKKMNTTCS